MRALTGLALLLGVTALALSLVTLVRDDDPQWREVRLGLAEKEDQFKVSDVAPEARSDETFQLPVTGGSGAYEGASGQVTVREDGQAEHNMTLLMPVRD
jgi:hypothetical protein